MLSKNTNSEVNLKWQINKQKMITMVKNNDSCLNKLWFIFVIYLTFLQKAFMLDRGNYNVLKHINFKYRLHTYIFYEKKISKTGHCWTNQPSNYCEFAGTIKILWPKWAWKLLLNSNYKKNMRIESSNPSF